MTMFDTVTSSHGSVAPVCADCQVAAPPNARFCPNCGAKLAAAKILRATTQRRQLTVMFCDLVGSSALSAGLDPEDFSDIIAAFQRCVTDIAAEQGGFLARYMGDGALIWFGYPQAEEDDPERAVQAALAIVDAIGRLSVPGARPLQVRIGLATGLVVVGDMAAAGAARNLDVMGDTPNLAARLQSLAEPNAVMVSGHLHALVAHLFEWFDDGRRTIKGWAKPVHVWQVLRPARIADRFRARQGSSIAPLVGRAETADRLAALWRQARGGAGRVVLVTGEPGLGKSRLVAHMMGATGDRNVTRTRVFCSRQQQSAPLQPVIEQMVRLAGLSPGAEPEGEMAKLTEASLGAEPADLALVAELLGLPVAAPGPTATMTPLRKQRRTIEALVGILQRAARLRPVLAVIEDAHWADPTTLEMLALTVRVAAEMPMLLVVTTRPGFEPDWAHAESVERVRLAPLPPLDGAALVRWTAGVQELPAAVVSDILDRADGVPLYIEELTKAVLGTDADAIARVPVSLQASLNARLDRLSHRQGEGRHLAEMAAAIGRGFGLDLLAHVAVRQHADLDAALSGLVDSGIVEPCGAGQYQFRHALLHDAAYDMITRERRRALHGRIAGAILTHLPLLADAQPQQLAHHWSEAREHARAANAWRSAARQALRRSAPREALAVIETGLAALQQIAADPQTIRTEIELRILQVSSGSANSGPGVPVLGEAMRRVVELSRDQPDTPYLLFALYTLWLHAFTRGELASAQGQVADIAVYAEQRPGPGRLLCAVRAAGLTGFATGAFATSAADLARGISLYDPAIRPVFARMTVHDPVTDMRCYRSWDLLFMGLLTQARRESAGALAEARESGHFFTIGHALLTIAYIHLHCGALVEGLAVLDELDVLTEEQGIPYFQHAGLAFRGYFTGRTGDAAAGLLLVRDAIAWSRQTCTLLYIPGFTACEAELLARMGDTGGAAARMAEALAMMEATGARWDEAEIRTIGGIVHQLAGNAGAAAAAFAEAIAVARRQGARLRELRSATALAGLDLASAQHAQSLAEALGHFGEETAAPIVLHAKRLLAQMQRIGS